MSNDRKASVLWLRAKLLERGLTLTDFARIHGFNFYTVQCVIARHWGKETRPWGKESNAILDALKSYCHNDPPPFCSDSDDSDSFPCLASNLK